MFYFDVCEIGRESVKSVNALILASLIKELVNKHEKNHKSNHRRCCYIRCGEKLEISPRKHRKTGDDEGFESDANEEDSLSGDASNEDAQSTTSSCYFVDDHVFKLRKSETGKEPTSLGSTFGSIDSANSSGGSDSDEVDTHSLTPSPVTQNKKLVKIDLFPEGEKKEAKHKKEEYPIADVIFCHTEPKYPTVIAWVIKKHQQTELDLGSRLGTSGVENFLKAENCLEVIVVKCKDADSLKELCSSYQEYSRRVKLDQYKSIKRRKDDDKVKSSPLLGSRDVKVSLSDLKVANSSLIKASELSILNPKIVTSFGADLKNSVSLNSLIKPEQQKATTQDSKQTLEISVKKTQSLMNLSKSWDIKSDTLTRVPFRSKLDEFNLIQRTDLNGVTHLEVSKIRNKTSESYGSKSKLRKEIEGVILTDVESYAKKEQIRQRTNAEDGNAYEAPPIRPERRKYLKKKTGDGQQDQIGQTKSAISFYLAPQQNDRSQKVLKGPYVRAQSWGNQNVPEQSLNTWKDEPKPRHVSKCEDKYSERRRSKSAGRAPKKTPMAYRYVDITTDYRGSPTKCLPAKVQLCGDDAMRGRRRNSFDDIMAVDLQSKGNLKSVIKKNKKISDKRCEPKKVTFSAFATVQVVD